MNAKQGIHGLSGGQYNFNDLKNELQGAFVVRLGAFILCMLLQENSCDQSNWVMERDLMQLNITFSLTYGKMNKFDKYLKLDCFISILHKYTYSSCISNLTHMFRDKLHMHSNVLSRCASN